MTRRVMATCLPAFVAMFVCAAIGTATAQTFTYKVLHEFAGSPTDGAYPDYGSSIADSSGNLYGTTQNGGASGAGIVFKLDQTGTETVLYNFTGGADGDNPVSGVIRNADGNLYGTTVGGGASGAGVVFKLDTTGTETVLHSFKGGSHGKDPIAGLLRDYAGSLYGTTSSTGTHDYGLVFQLKP